jgi:hypothetical protein
MLAGSANWFAEAFDATDLKDAAARRVEQLILMADPRPIKSDLDSKPGLGPFLPAGGFQARFCLLRSEYGVSGRGVCSPLFSASFLPLCKWYKRFR